jgi:hypothetical protein
MSEFLSDKPKEVEHLKCGIGYNKMVNHLAGTFPFLKFMGYSKPSSVFNFYFA